MSFLSIDAAACSVPGAMPSDRAPTAIAAVARSVGWGSTSPSPIVPKSSCSWNSNCRIAGLSVKTIWATPMFPHSPLCWSTISSRAVLPCHCRTSIDACRILLLFSPVADQTAFPSIEQIEARLSGVVPAADPEVDEMPLDQERFAGERADLVVLRRDVSARCGGVGVDHSRSRRADVALIGRHLRLEDRPAAEGRAGHFPTLISFLLEILKDDVSPLCYRRSRRRLYGAAIEPVEAPLAENAVLALPEAGFFRIFAHGVFEPADQFTVDVFAADILDGKTHDRCRQTRILAVERNKRRKCFERHGYRRRRIAILDPCRSDTRRRT